MPLAGMVMNSWARHAAVTSLFRRVVAAVVQLGGGVDGNVEHRMVGDVLDQFALQEHSPAVVQGPFVLLARHHGGSLPVRDRVVFIRFKSKRTVSSIGGRA